MNYAYAIKTLRSICELEQRDLANILNVDSSFISKIESGAKKLPKEMISRIGVVLKLDPKIIHLLANEEIQDIDEGTRLLLGEFLIKASIEANKKIELNIFGFKSLNEFVRKLQTTKKELRYLADNFGTDYHPSYIKSGSKKRKIDRPKGDIKEFQKKLANIILKKVNIPSIFHGYAKGKSYLSGALEHVNSEVVLSIDIANFFPNVTHKHVFRVWKEFFDYSTEISGILTRLTTYAGGLPQGAPTSGYLATIVLFPLAEELSTLAKKLDLKVTIYADDIVFSGAISKKESSKIITEVLVILKRFGFATKCKKVEVMSNSKKQIVTGIQVNNGQTQIPLKKFKELAKRLGSKSTSSASKAGILNFAKTVNKKQYSKLKSINTTYK